MICAWNDCSSSNVINKIIYIQNLDISECILADRHGITFNPDQFH